MCFYVTLCPCYPKAQIQKADARDNDLFSSALLYLQFLEKKIKKNKAVNTLRAC